MERDNYIQAVSREQMIKEEELRQLVNRLGMQMGLKAGDSYREDASGSRFIIRIPLGSAHLRTDELFPGKMK